MAGSDQAGGQGPGGWWANGTLRMGHATMGKLESGDVETRFATSLPNQLAGTGRLKLKFDRHYIRSAVQVSRRVARRDAGNGLSWFHNPRSGQRKTSRNTEEHTAAKASSIAVQCGCICSRKNDIKAMRKTQRLGIRIRNQYLAHPDHDTSRNPPGPPSLLVASSYCPKTNYTALVFRQGINKHPRV